MLRWDGSAPGRDAILPVMSEPPYRLTDLGDRRVLTVNGHEYATAYSARVIRMLIERKGLARTAPYLSYKETRGPHFLGPLFRWLRAHGARGLAVLEVGCSFGHMTEYLAEQSEVVTIDTFDTDEAFVAMTRAKVEELGLKTVRAVLRRGHRRGGLRLAFLPRSRGVAPGACAAAGLCRLRRAPARGRPAAVALPAVPEPPHSQGGASRPLRWR